MFHFPTKTQGVHSFLDNLLFLRLRRQLPDVDAGDCEEDGQPKHVYVLLPALGGAKEGAHRVSSGSWV